MNQNPPLLATLPLLQRPLNPAPRPLKLPQQILVRHIIDIDTEMLVLLPVLELCEVVLQHRDHVRDAVLGQRVFAPEGEDPNCVFSVGFLEVRRGEESWGGGVKRKRKGKGGITCVRGLAGGRQEGNSPANI